MVPWPSGKAKVCKTFIPQFKSGRYLQKSASDVRSLPFFTVKIDQVRGIDMTEEEKLDAGPYYDFWNTKKGWRPPSLYVSSIRVKDQTAPMGFATQAPQ